MVTDPIIASYPHRVQFTCTVTYPHIHGANVTDPGMALLCIIAVEFV